MDYMLINMPDMFSNNTWIDYDAISDCFGYEF